MNLRAGFPFWLIKNGLPFDYPKLEYSLNTDVLILGGGISGALVAYHLIEAGIDCTVVDARSIGLGSTCASTSLLQYEIDVPLCELKNKVGLHNAVRSYHLCAESIEKLGAIAKHIGFNDFEYKKSLYYAAFKKDVSFLKNEYKIRNENGFKVKYLEQEDVLDQFGFTAPSAILSEHGAQTNAYAFTHALHQYSIKKGLKVYDRSPIVKIDHQKSGVKLKTENGCNILAKKLVYATGYEAIHFIDKKIVDLKSTYATCSEQFSSDKQFWEDEVMIWNTADPYLYMRTTKDRRILVGGRDEQFYNPKKRDGLILKKSKQLVKDFNKVFPDIDFKPEFNWTGVFGSTMDGLPFIGRYPKLPNGLFALGFGGNGITFSLIAAEILVDLIQGKNNADAQIFTFERV